MVSIKVWSDYVCPFCLLAKEPLRQAVLGADAEIEWMPFELRPHPTPTLRPEGSYRQGAWERSVYPPAERMGPAGRLPDVSPQPYTRLAFERYQFARGHGLGQSCVPRMLRAFFHVDRDLGDLEVLTRIAAELGLPAAEFRTVLEQGTYATAHRCALAAADRHRITSVPTVIVDGTHRIEGVPAVARLRAAIAAARAEDTVPARAGAAQGSSRW
ncbi:DsbA family protein [Streptomyces sp. DG2A-72]|uniref:DsbA family oxidoreductase n=1 Tax=Streptomyces sp. DG2A-72 TaxID=3051386 RepID=UPI00265C3A93|nr:DsbA family protein [Streptomyces sp. DG2A-72]MDO0939383.1 DsbA family protein [Streptomyces sp. DG2A-72]